MLRDTKLAARAKREVDDCLLPNKSKEKLFDIAQLCRQPLLQSVFAETLRLRTALFLVRGSDHNDLLLGSFRLDRGEMIAIDTGTAHLDSHFWAGPRKDNVHHPGQFWAERFLIDSSRSNEHEWRISGPEKCQTSNFQNATSPHKVKFSLHGLEGAWIPFGGGMRQCPGKQFAKQEIIISFAIMSSMFDIELLTDQDPGVDSDYYGLGGMPPKGKVPFRIRRKAGMDQMQA